MSNIFANKSTASRELGKMGIPKEMRAELIKGDVAPFEINEKEVRKVLKALKAGKEEKAASKESAEASVIAMFEADRLDNTSKAAQVFATAPAQPAPAEHTAPVTVTASSDTSEQEKPAAERTVRKTNPRQNGKSRPSKGVCCAIWDELDKYITDMNGQIPTPAEAQQMGIANNWHKVTVYRQYNDWMVFHGHK